MKKLFQNKKLVIILSIVLAVVLAASAGILVWQLTNKDDTSDSNTYTITFVTNGGNKIEPMKVEKGTVLSQTDLPVPSKRGEMFLSWNTDEALTVPYWNTPIERDMTLYASYLEPAEDAQTHELTQSTIPFADTDFSVTVRSSVELTNENIGNYVLLTVNYGKHANGDAIKLSVTAEGGGIYRVSGNFAAGGDYIISLVSDAVTFNPEDEMLVTYGLTETLRTLRFRIVGEDYMSGNLSDKVADIPDEDIIVTDNDSVTIAGGNHALIGATEEENGIIRVGEGDDISDYYKIVGIESSAAEGITYTVRPAEVDEVYDHVMGYQWESLDGDDFVINEEVKQQVMDNLSNNEQLNNYVKYLTLAATQTPTYQTLSTQEFGEVVAMPLATVVVPSGFTFGLDFDVRNDNFSDILDEEYRDKFAKLTLGIQYEVKIAKLGKVGSVTAFVELQVDFWIYFGMGGEFEIGWLTYDIDYGAVTMTQTEVSFTIGLMTSDGKKFPNIDDEIEAIFESAKNPTPDNLLEQYNELMSGNSTPIELFNNEIFEVPVLSLLGGVVEISVPIRFVVSLDIEASFSSYITVLTTDAFGIQGDEDTGLDVYFDSLPARSKYRLELRGRIELRAGIEAGIKLSLAYNLASVSMNLQTGFYGEIHGYFFYEVDLLNRPYQSMNKGGAYYFEFGIYVDIRLRAEACHIKYSGSFWDKKFPIFSAGQKEIVYGFVKTAGEVIVMEGTPSVNIEDTGILDVYVYDITKERSETNPRIVEDYPFSNLTFDYSFSDGNFRIYSKQANKLGRVNYEIGYAASALEGNYASEAILTLNFIGQQISFRDTLTKYVTVKYSISDDVDWDKLNTTCKVDFTIDGEVIFTREVPYGKLLTDQPSLWYITHDDGTVEASYLYHSEREAVHDAGYGYVAWEIQSGKPLYVTEDMSIEALHNSSGPAKRMCTVTIVDEDRSEVLQVRHGEQIELHLPDLPKVVTTRYIYEFVGWRTDDNRVYSISEPYTVTGDVTLSPQYSQTTREYFVTFDGNGGTVGNGSTFTTSVAYGNMPAYPFTPEREPTATTRYVFAGWSPALSSVTGDVTYKAQWKESKRYTVTFDAGKGQFDASGKKKITITVDEGYTLSASDIPMNPYIKTNNGYYDFEAWSAAVSAGTVINGNVTYTATYKNELTVRTGITISDGVNTEDIAAFLNGTNKVSGYRYVLNAEYFGNTLVITSPGLTISGEDNDIHIEIQNTNVTFKDLALSYTGNGHVNTLGKVNMTIGGTVSITTNRDGDTLRGDGMEDPTDPYSYIDADVTLRGADGSSKLIINSKQYGIAVYGSLTVENLAMDLTVASDEYDAAVAIQVSGDLTVGDSDIVINKGVFTVAQLDMTNSNLKFKSATFTPGYTSGLFILNLYMTEADAIITLKNSQISFTHDIAISIAVTIDYDLSYYINTSMESIEIISSYSSLDDFLADVNTNGYSGMVVMDSKSSIK